MTQKELNEILHKHKLWLDGNPDETKANLRGADLREADLRWADLRWADLREADLSQADLNRADLSRADLRGAYLRGADLRGADLRGADLRGAYLIGAYLIGAYLRGADLIGADLRGADLIGADLRGADLTNVMANYATTGYYLICPEEGSFIGFKKTREGMVKLEVPADALRSSATTRKCRCSKAKVLELPEGVTEAHSRHDNSFIYRLGEIVEVKDFNIDRWNECSSGVHFFMTRAEAETWY